MQNDDHLKKQADRLSQTITKVVVSAIQEHNVHPDQVKTLIDRPEIIFGLVSGLFIEDKKIKKNLLGLKTVSSDQSFMVEALDGQEYIFGAVEIFKSYIDGDFKNWKLDSSGPATPETLLDVYEMVNDGTLIQIFTSISSDLDKFLVTQAQIIRFCKKYISWICQERHPIFFLMKVEGRYFAVEVGPDADGLDVRVIHIENTRIWLGKEPHRIVSPHLGI